MSDKFLSVKDLKCEIDGNLIFDSVSFDVKRGEFVTLVGPSGCGKTTLLRVLAGLQNKSSGKVDFKFREDKLNVPISIAYQNATLFPWLNLVENLTICMNNGTLSETEKRKRAMEHLERAHLARYWSYYPRQISGGMQQKVNILRSFCCDSEFILMDEPFVFLDFLQRSELQAFTLDIWESEKKTILFVTHNLSEAILISDRVLVLSGAKGPLAHEATIDITRPRNIDDLRDHPKFLELFGKIKRILNDEILKAREKNEFAS